MSNINDAKKACKQLQQAMHVCDCAKIERELNNTVRSPNTAAKSYIHGYWVASRRFSSRNGMDDTALLRYSAVGGWKCFNVDSDN